MSIPPDGSPAEDPSEPWLDERSRARWRAWRRIVLISTIAVILATALGLPEGVRGPLTVGYLVFCPGMAVVLLLRLNDAIAEVMLALALSLAITGIIPGVFLYLGVWSPASSLAVLVILTWVALGVDLVRNRSDVPRFARQRLRREFQARPMHGTSWAPGMELGRARASALAGIDPGARRSLEPRNARLPSKPIVRSVAPEDDVVAAATPPPATGRKTRKVETPPPVAAPAPDPLAGSSRAATARRPRAELPADVAIQAAPAAAGRRSREAEAAAAAPPSPTRRARKVEAPLSETAPGPTIGPARRIQTPPAAAARPPAGRTPREVETPPAEPARPPATRASRRVETPPATVPQDAPARKARSVKPAPSAAPPPAADPAARKVAKRRPADD